MNYDPPKARLEDIETEAYRDPSLLAQWTTWSLYALIAFTLFSIVTAVLTRLLMQEAGFGTATTPDQMARATAADQRTAYAAGAQFACFVLSGVLCLRWIHRMAWNSRIRARFAEYTPGWAVGWYFIPIAYWWKPYQAMKEIWANSAEQAGPRGEDSTTLLGWWWALWVIESIVSNVSFRLTLGAETVDRLLLANGVQVLGDVIQIPLCLVFIVMVRRLTALQEYANDNPPPPAEDLRTA